MRLQGQQDEPVTDPGKSKGVHFKPKEQCDSVTTTDRITKAGEAGENNNDWYVLNGGVDSSKFSVHVPGDDV